MRTASQNLLRLLAENLGAYAVKDAAHTTAATTRTMSKFGPSESLKKKNKVLAPATAVVARMNSGICFEAKGALIMHQ